MDKLYFSGLPGTVLALVTLALAGCGGGGGGGGASAPTGLATSTLSFPLKSALEIQAANGFMASLNANGDGSVPTNGDCAGTFNLSGGLANTATTFEGVPAFSAVQVLNISFTNCIPATIAETTTVYYNSTYVPLGAQILGGNYGMYAPLPTYPSVVKVGDTAIVGTAQFFSDSTKAVPTGRMDVSFVVEPDTADTAIINVIFKVYDAASALSATEQDKYRIASTGALTLISVDIQQVNPALHLVFR